jgi:hypothetical protein
MCHRFSCIVLTVGNFPILWSEPDPDSGLQHHDTVIVRKCLRDDGLGRFIKLECRPPFDDVQLDETDKESNDWWNTHQYEIEPKVIELAQQVEDIYQTYRKQMQAVGIELYYKGIEIKRAEQFNNKSIDWEKLDTWWNDIQGKFYAEYIQNLYLVEGYVPRITGLK